jgi:hypothetical protein
VIVPLGKGLAFAVPVGEGQVVGQRGGADQPWAGAELKGGRGLAGAGGPGAAAFTAFGPRGQLWLTRTDRRGGRHHLRPRLPVRAVAAAPAFLQGVLWIGLLDDRGQLWAGPVPDDLRRGDGLELPLQPLPAKPARPGSALAALAFEAHLLFAFAGADDRPWTVEGDPSGWGAGPVDGGGPVGDGGLSGAVVGGAAWLAWADPAGQPWLAAGRGQKLRVTPLSPLAR